MWLRSQAVAFPLVLFLNSAVAHTAMAQTPPVNTGAGVGAIQTEEVNEDVEYLTRGPLHEAFAEPYSADVDPSPFISAEPPASIDELPPEHRPEGKNVHWISGYWAWDEEREDFLWVSGVWRQFPPNQRWVPGYWSTSAEGHQWVNGFWTGIEVAEIEYLPLPPVTIEEGPSSPAPQEDYFYVPGTWVYDAGEYRWQPGFWTQTQPNWVWTPAQYTWTPRGAVHCPGYWDYDVAHRGIVFTPVYYREPLYRSTAYVYRPRYSIDTGINLFVHLFVRPAHRSYYFGDYYGPRYADQYLPWVATYQRPQSYDPFYSHYRYSTQYRSADALNWISTQHQYFTTDEQYRPPRTIEAQRQFIRANLNGQVAPTILRLASSGESFDNVVQQQDSVFNFRALASDEVQQIRERVRPLRELSETRRSAETEVAARLPGTADSGVTDGNEQASGAATNGGRGQTVLPRFQSDADLDQQADADQPQPASGDQPAGTDQPAGVSARPGLNDAPGKTPDMVRDTDRPETATPDSAGTQPIRPGQRPDANAGTTPDTTDNRPNGLRSDQPQTRLLRPGADRPGAVDARERMNRLRDQGERLEREPRTDAATTGRLRPNALRGGDGSESPGTSGNVSDRRRREERMQPPRPSDWPGGDIRGVRGDLSVPPPRPPIGANSIPPSQIPTDTRVPSAQQPVLEGTNRISRPASLPTVDGRGPGVRSGVNPGTRARERAIRRAQPKPGTEGVIPRD